MHEFSISGTISAARHGKLLRQLAGYTCMQPQPVQEIHLIFKARYPPGAAKLFEGSNGGSQAVSQQPQDVQKLKTMLQSGIYFVKLVGEISQDPINDKAPKWTFEFKDSPEAGQQKTNAQAVWRTPIEDGELHNFLNFFGYEYVQRYMVEGQQFYIQDSAISIQRIRKCPDLGDGQDATTTSDVNSMENLELLDPSGAYLVEVSLDAVDGRNQDLRDRAEKQLLSIQRDLASTLRLEKPDRLSLETRLPAARD